MLRLVSTLALLLVVNLPFLSRAAFAASPSGGATVRVLVRLQGPPVAADSNLRVRSRATRFHLRFDPTLAPARSYSRALQSYQNQEIRFIEQRGIQLSVGRRFSALFNGFSAVVPRSQLSALRHLTNVAGVLPEKTYYPQLDRSLPLINVPQAWSELGGSPTAGRGEYIAQVDTGIDTKSACFNDAGMPAPPLGHRADTQENMAFTNNKVIVARAFGPDSTKTYSADDQQGHGTFGGAIEACDYNTLTPNGTRISGVAPDAYLLNYNVFPGSQGTTSDEQILAGLNAALLDGADVVNMSLGSPTGTGDLRLDSESQAINVAIKAGVSVVVSVGNSGPTDQSASSPATTPDAIGVGAVTNSRSIAESLTVTGPGDVPASLVHMKARQGSHPFSGIVGPAPMIYVDWARKPGDDSSNPTADDFVGKPVQGKIAVIQRGGAPGGTPLTFEDKINNAAKAGAVGAIVFDNRVEVGTFSGDTKTATLPAMFISQADGQALLAWLRQHPDAQVKLDSTQFISETTPDILTDFSSRGYGVDFGIKPDLVAPGQDIYSATQNRYSSGDMYDPSGFTSKDGTSFSAPHVTGAVALLLQKHPKWTPSALKAALMDTANLNVYTDANKTPFSSVMQVGAGLVDVGAAVASSAYVQPSSVSFGAANAAVAAVSRDQTLTVNDAGAGDGAWQVAVQPLQGTAGLSVSAPASVTLPANGKVDLPLHLSVASSAANGDYDGYVVLTRGKESLHVPYFVHVGSLAVKPGSVLLVDDTLSRYQPPAPLTPVPHVDVSQWYEKALTTLGKTYTYWDEGKLGPPSLQDMKQASAVIYFTGANLNAFAAQNSNSEALMPPLDSVDVSVLHSYMDAGGHVFISGMGAGLSDPYWTTIVLGATLSTFSIYDNENNDKGLKGGISPPQPSAVPDVGVGPLAHAGIFAGLKPIDLSTKGDGAGDNIAVANPTLLRAAPPDTPQLVGVGGLTATTGTFGPGLNAYGQPALKTADTSIANGAVDIGVVSSDEPSLKHKASYPGRSVFFSFGFEGIDDNTGYTTREQLLQRIFQWFDDRPTAQVTGARYRAKARVQLQAGLRALAGVHAAQYIWQVGGSTLIATGKPTTYRFPRAGTYRLRVQITDTLGHVAVSPWKTITVS